MAASTYVITGTRPGGSSVVNETTTKTFTIAQPAVVQENGMGGGGGGGGGATAVRVMVQA